MTKPETGYEEGGEKDEIIVVFELVKTPYVYTGQGTPASVRRNGKPVGVIYLDSEDEFNWLKRRIDGEFNPEIYQVKIRGEEQR
jgi:hypothetical protein